VSQAESFRISRYEHDGVRRVFLNSGIDFRHFYFEQEPRLDETSDELNARYLRGAVETGCRAVRTCLDLAGLSPRDVDLLVVCSSTGYVCPDIIGAAASWAFERGAQSSRLAGPEAGQREPLVGPAS
jgi:alkylresorcinol/alkylpyrone synthase